LWRDRYRDEGRSGLCDRSHATRCCPHRTAKALEDLIVEERRRWGWGSKKLLERLSETYPEVEFPPRSTIDAILSRRGLVALQRDNGPPFGTANGRFSTMSVRLMSLGVQPVFSRPGKPQDNGRHERMHRDLKADIIHHRGWTQGSNRSTSIDSDGCTTSNALTKESDKSGRLVGSDRRRDRICASLANRSTLRTGRSGR